MNTVASVSSSVGTDGRRLRFQIAERLTQYIQSGRTVNGGRLPPVRELAECYNVSRNVVREAVTYLEMMGIVEVRRGLGVFVRQSKRRGGLPQFSLQALSSQGGSPAREEVDSALDVLEACLVLIPNIATMAAARIGNDEILELRTLLKSMQTGTQSASQLIQLDEQFYVALAQASLNGVLVARVQWLWQQLKQFKLAALYEGYSRNNTVFIEGHRSLLSALMQRNELLAGEAMKIHLIQFTEDYKRLV